jgi:hypothetical protein
MLAGNMRVAKKCRKNVHNVQNKMKKTFTKGE